MHWYRVIYTANRLSSLMVARTRFSRIWGPEGGHETCSTHGRTVFVFLHGLAGDLVVFGRGSANDCSGRDVRF